MYSFETNEKLCTVSKRMKMKIHSSHVQFVNENENTQFANENENVQFQNK
jgi:hypothetical protein